MSDLAAMFDAHVQAEFQDRDLEATMETMTDENPYELLMTFTHDSVVDIMLPGIEPTGRPIAIVVVVVVGFEQGKVHHEHIYWDQASVLVQAGLLDPEILPIVGEQQAAALVDQTQPKNEVIPDARG